MSDEAAGKLLDAAMQLVNVLDLKLAGGDGAELTMTDWSFTQLCSLCRVHKGTVNRLQANTAAQIFRETLPSTGKPMQVLATYMYKHRTAIDTFVQKGQVESEAIEGRIADMINYRLLAWKMIAYEKRQEVQVPPPQPDP